MNYINQYRKKPVVIEAMRLDETNVTDACRWSGAVPWTYKNTNNPLKRRGTVGVTIKTLEGNMGAEFGDYIIKGVNGEFYPCKPDVFDKTYEAVE